MTLDCDIDVARRVLAGKGRGTDARSMRDQLRALLVCASGPLHPGQYKRFHEALLLRPQLHVRKLVMLKDLRFQDCTNEKPFLAGMRDSATVRSVLEHFHYSTWTGMVYAWDDDFFRPTRYSDPDTLQAPLQSLLQVLSPLNTRYLREQAMWGPNFYS